MKKIRESSNISFFFFQEDVMEDFEIFNYAYGEIKYFVSKHRMEK